MIKAKRLPYLGLLVLLFTGCTDFREKAPKSPCNFSVIARQAIPSLASYYSDMGSFPDKAVGWKALVENTEKGDSKPKWGGPYIWDEASSAASYTQKLELLGGHALYSSDETAHVVKLDIVSRLGKECGKRTVTLVRDSDIAMCQLSQRQRRIVSESVNLLNAIEQYHQNKGAYPDNVDFLKGLGNDGQLTEQWLQQCGLVDYWRLYSHDGGYLVFFSGESQGSARDFNVSSKCGECEVLIIMANRQRFVFWAFGDS